MAPGGIRAGVTLTEGSDGRPVLLATAEGPAGGLEISVIDPLEPELEPLYPDQAAADVR